MNRPNPNPHVFGTKIVHNIFQMHTYDLAPAQASANKTTRWTNHPHNIQAARTAGQEGTGEEANATPHINPQTNKVPAICGEECEGVQTWDPWEGGEPGVDPVVMPAARWQGAQAIEAMRELGNRRALSVYMWGEEGLRGSGARISMGLDWYLPPYKKEWLFYF